MVVPLGHRRRSRSPETTPGPANPFGEPAAISSVVWPFAQLKHFSWRSGFDLGHSSSCIAMSCEQEEVGCRAVPAEAAVDGGGGDWSRSPGTETSALLEDDLFGDKGADADAAALGDGTPPSAGAGRSSEATNSEAAASSSGQAAGSPAPKEPPLTLRQKVLLLKEEQRQLRAQNKAKTREIRNTERRNARLKAKVTGLTDNDLNEVLRARAEAKAEATKAGKASPKSKASPKEKAAPDASSLKRGTSMAALPPGGTWPPGNYGL